MKNEILSNNDDLISHIVSYTV